MRFACCKRARAAVWHCRSEHKQMKRLRAEEGPLGAPWGCWYPWQGCEMEKPLWLVENCQRQLWHTRKLARKDQRGTVEKLG